MDGSSKFLGNDRVKKWSKRAGFLAIFGITGLVCVGAINIYRFNKGLDLIDLDGENWWK